MESSRRQQLPGTVRGTAWKAVGRTEMVLGEHCFQFLFRPILPAPSRGIPFLSTYKLNLANDLKEGGEAPAKRKPLSSRLPSKLPLQSYKKNGKLQAFGSPTCLTCPCKVIIFFGSNLAKTKRRLPHHTTHGWQRARESYGAAI